MIPTEFLRLFTELGHAQKQLDEILTELASMSSSFENGRWSGTLLDWWRQSSSHVPSEIEPHFQKLIDHSVVLFDLAEQLSHGGSKSGRDQEHELAVLLEQFQKALTAGIEGTQTSANPAFSPMCRLLGDWRRQADSLMGIDSNFLASLRPGYDITEVEILQRHLMKIAGIGEIADFVPQPGQLEPFLKALVDYQTQFNRYTRLSMYTAGAAAREMQETLEEEEQSCPRGVRELYAHWLCCCENAYDNLIREPEFSDIYAALVNSAIAVRVKKQAITDSILHTIDVPTKAEYRELTRRLAEYQRRQRSFERQIRNSKDGKDHNPETGVAAKAGTPEATQSIANKTPSARISTTKKKTVRKTAKKKVARKTKSTTKPRGSTVKKRVARKTIKKTRSTADVEKGT